MTEMRASLVVDLAGNLASRARLYERSLSRVGQTGVRSFTRMNRALAASARGLTWMGNRWVALAGGVAAGAAVRSAMQIEERVERLGVQANVTSEQVQGVWDRINEVAKMEGIKADPKEVLAGVEQIVEMTGDLEFATDNLENLGRAIQATGAGGTNIGAIAAELQKMDIKAPEGVAEALDILNAQGKQGAFTLQNLAALGPRVFAAYRASGRGGMGAIREMGAALQMIRQGTGSSEMAATAFEALMRTLQDADKVKMLQGGGVRLFEDDGTTLRPINELMGEIIRTAGGSATVLSEVFDAEAMRAFNTAVAQFKSTGGLAMLDKFMAVQAGGQTAADAERISRLALAQVESGKGAIQKSLEEGINSVSSHVVTGISQLVEGEMQEARSTFEKLDADMRARLLPGWLQPSAGRPAPTLEDNATRLSGSMGDLDAARARLDAALSGKVEIEVRAAPGTEARVRSVKGDGVSVDSGRIMSNP